MVTAVAPKIRTETNCRFTTMAALPDTLIQHSLGGISYAPINSSFPKN